MKFYSPVDLSQNELRNAVVQQLASAPSSPVTGQLYGNTSTKVLSYWNGTAWRPLDAAALTDGSIQIAALATNPLARANHTGTQTSSTISDLSTTVKAYTLDTFAAPVASVSWNGQRIVSLANGVGAQDAVTLSQVNSIIAAAIAGQTAIKNPARVCATTNLTLSGLQTVDGVSLAAGDRVLAPFQSTASQVGLYVAASGAWSLATDGNVTSEWLEGTEILIAEGSTYGGSIFRQTAVNPTVTTLTFTQTAKINTYTADNITLTLTGTQFSVNYGAGLTTSGGKLVLDTTVAARKFTGTITCDGSTTSFQFTHGLGTAALGVTARDSSGNAVWIDNVSTSTTITFTFATAQANGVTFTVIVTG